LYIKDILVKLWEIENEEMSDLIEENELVIELDKTK